MNKRIFWAALSALAVAGPLHAETAFISFDDLDPMVAGDCVEGCALLHPYLDIEHLTGEIQLIQVNNWAAGAFVAPNDDNVVNNCLEDINGDRVQVLAGDPPPQAFGIANIDIADPLSPQEYRFTFNGRLVEEFSILMVDFGDWNPTRATYHEVNLTAYRNGGQADQFHYSYHSDGAGVHNISPEYGELWIHGDACTCDCLPVDQKPGHLHMTVQNATTGFDTVELRSPAGHDPAIALDSLFIRFYDRLVPLDIHPTSCPNPINLGNGISGARGVTPVAILGTDEIDVMEIDPATVRLEGVAPLRWNYSDVATPYEPYTGKEDIMDCTTEGPDGFKDLTLKFSTAELAAAIGSIPHGEAVVLGVTGNMLDGRPFFGEDVVKIINR